MNGDEQWSVGHDGCGKWAIYVGNETLKGWSGKGKILVGGLREIDARTLVTTHELTIAQARAPLVAALERAEQGFLAIAQHPCPYSNVSPGIEARACRAAVTGTGGAL